MTLYVLLGPTAVGKTELALQMAAIKLRYERQNILFILGCAIIRAYVVCADKVMLDTILLFLGRSSCAYLHATIYLPAVTIQDRFLIFSCYSLKVCIQFSVSFPFCLAFCSSAQAKGFWHIVLVAPQHM